MTHISRRQFTFSAAAAAASEARANVIIFYVDELRATALKLYQAGGVATPNLERLARRGTLFEQAFTPHPLCVPARASLWTGQYTSTHGSRSNQQFLRDDRETMAAAFHQAGYTLGIFGKNHCFTDAQLAKWFAEDYSLGSAKWQAALGPEEKQLVQKHRAWMKERGGGTMPPSISPFPPEIHETHLSSQRAREFVEKYKDKPFTAWISITDPHHPIQTPRPFADALPMERVEMPLRKKGANAKKNNRLRIYDYLVRGSEIPEDFLRSYLSIYCGMVAFIDYELGLLLDLLDRHKLTDKTIIVFTSDHGDFAAEHNLIIKTGSLLDCMTRIPLVVSWPGRVPEGRREKALVSHVDLMPTLLAWCGLPVPKGVEGLPLPFRPEDKRREWIYSEYGAGGPQFTWEEARALGPAKRLGDYSLRSPEEGQGLRKREWEGHLRMARTHTHKLILDTNGDCEFYDLEKDPGELDNACGRPEYRAVEERLRKALQERPIVLAR